MSLQVEVLLSLGASPAVRTATAGAPLALATKGGHADVVGILQRAVKAAERRAASGEDTGGGSDGGGDGGGRRSGGEGQGQGCDFDRGCSLS